MPFRESNSHVQHVFLFVCCVNILKKKISNQKYGLRDINKYDSVGEGAFGKGLHEEQQPGYSQLESVYGTSYLKNRTFIKFPRENSGRTSRRTLPRTSGP